MRISGPTRFVVAALLFVNLSAQAAAQELEIAPEICGFQSCNHDVHANELSSLEWRSCAGYHFYMAEVEYRGMLNLAHSQLMRGYAAMYASEIKAKAEARAGLGSGLGRSLTDPSTGKLMVPRKSMIVTHTALARAKDTLSAYAKPYQNACSGPVSAFMRRFSQ